MGGVRVRWRNAGLGLGVLVLGALLGGLPGAAGGRSARADEAPAGQASKPRRAPAQSAAEADRELARLMAERKGVRAATARGQTVKDAPPFTVASRTERMRQFPCTKCHDNKFVDTRVRELQEEHTKLDFDHGGGRFWCYDACHKGTDIDSLASIRGRPISYDESYRLCAQCHFQRLDWFFGGHGKRQGAWEKQDKIPPTAEELRVEDREQIGRWQGERVLLSCTECHDAHSPSFKPVEPSPPPRVRAGLTRPRPPAPPEKAWRPAGDRKGAR